MRPSPCRPQVKHLQVSVFSLILLSSVYCLLSTVYCLLSTVYFLLSNVYCLPSTVYCLLSTLYCILPTVYCIFTVSVEKGFGSKGKQHHKHTPSETQSHNKWSKTNAKKIMEYFPISSDQALIPAWPILTSVYLAHHGNKVLPVTKESFILDLEMRQNIYCHLFASAWLCGSASKWALKTWCWWGCCR